MDLTRIERLRVCAADDVATESERAELAAAGFDPGGWDPLRAVMQAALTPVVHRDLASGAFADSVLRAVGHGAAANDHGALRAALAAPAAPDLADAVLAALDLSEPSLADLRGLLLDAGPEPELSSAVMRSLGQAASVSASAGAALRQGAGVAPELGDGVLGALGATDGIGAVLRSALAPGAAPDVADAVLAQIGAEASAPVGDALAGGAGPAPDLWGGIAAAIGAESAARQTSTPPPSAAVRAAPSAQTPSASPVISLDRARAARRPWFAGAAAMAAAAAALVVALGPWGGDVEAPFDYELAAVNTVEIEDISVGDDAIVQVLQFEDDAPTIIFIDVLAEPLSDDGDEGATL